MHCSRIVVAALAGGIALAAPAQAELYQFVITGDYTASFVLESSPVPGSHLIGTSFALLDQPGFPDALFGVADITFYSAAVGGGMAIVDYYGTGASLLTTDGPQLYSGSENAPSFLTGTFALTEYRGQGAYTLTISAPNAGVPEPATWAMVIGGFGLIGSAMRRRGYGKGETRVDFAT